MTKEIKTPFGTLMHQGTIHLFQTMHQKPMQRVFLP